jgi:hypothetical protein
MMQPYRDPTADHIQYPILSDYGDIDLLINSTPMPTVICLVDHIHGFDVNLYNKMLSQLDALACDRKILLTVIYQGKLEEKIRKQYPNLLFKFDPLIPGLHYRAFTQYRQHPPIDIQNFICSFNGSDHVSRKLLTAALHRRGWFDTQLSTKNFVMAVDSVDGHVSDYMGDKSRLYRKFFIGDNSADFFKNIYSHGWVRFEHNKNVVTLSQILTKCFVHVVSETMSTSYAPFVTEKSLYSIVNRGLFLTYGQPGWHDYVEQYHGFKKYTKIFDYRFDAIVNPVERLIALLDELSKFSKLSATDWQDLYEMEIDTIEYNYNHYHSGSFFRQLENQYDYCAQAI